MLNVVMFSVVYAEFFYAEFCLFWVSFILSVVFWVSFMLYATNKPFMLSVIMLNVVMFSVVMLSVVVPELQPVLKNFCAGK